jgi:ethanolamine utilization protein EutQ (cupin superfamily)
MAFKGGTGMVQIVKPDQRDLKPFDVPGIEVHVSDPIIGKDDGFAAGFTEYVSAGTLEWTFDYNEVFFMISGALEVHEEGKDPALFEAGDLGYIEKGTTTVIKVPKGALFLHVTQPAWRE